METMENGNTEKKIDKIDAKIIRLLQKDGRMPNTEIAKLVGITEATVRNRLNRLTKDEVIRIVAVGNPFKLGFKIVGNIKIIIQLNKADKIIEELVKLDELWYITLFSGGSDLDILFHVRSLQQLRELLYGKISKIDGVINTQTSFLLERIKASYEWGTGLDDDDCNE
ncbi:Lrp/AsnC family transcriptional regulator [Desulfocastanea catecholica]